ncbi:ATP-binding protein [Rhodanobacter sp. FDAARGOS 1247]|uniref:AAA family ATPase n=1 Tax=Rhodanobacter sp. FDAARGOS 1247 TaxID=2778082 RepID=UPI00195177B7|nr:ATP-binding protein [Rhodanobacter sp. FDAARGOS 1247]QRP64086.1 ATP-binding protein [Rhodanobacter sp. FDAARGOS 1247]
MIKLNLPDIDPSGFDRDWHETYGEKHVLPICPLVRQWVLRVLACIDGGMLREIEEHQGSMAGVFTAVGLGKVASVAGRSKRSTRKIALQARLEQLLRDARKSPASLPVVLVENVSRIARLVGLSEVDRGILAFTVLLHGNRVLRKAVSLLEYLTTSQTFQVLADVLCLPVEQVRAALSPRGALGRAGLVRLDRTEDMELTGKLEILSMDFVAEMQMPDMTPANLLRGILSVGSPPELALTDYEHVAAPLAILRPYLARAMADARVGVNVLIHGAPGTGKSQLARVLAAELGSELYEVACEDAEGDPVEGKQRLRVVSAAQCFFARQRVIILFDEVEDVFNDSEGLFGRKSTAQTRKAWVNNTLESNALPIFWLANSIDSVDQAFIRRFDMVLELPVPPQRQRERIIGNACGATIDAGTVARIAESEKLAPAVITRAASVVASIRDDLGEQGAASAIELLINQTLRAQGHPRLRAAAMSTLQVPYDPALACADANLEEVMTGLQRARSGRLCLYGPPGTGKTAFGRWLADRLQMPLHVKRASDLMSMYVGGTEHAMAEAFEQACAEGAVLLIDEVDSFLQDRRGAQRSWEVTMVNEMLTQMESFPGIFVASTNLMDNLDPAALRRFDIKLRLDYLTTEQAWSLLQRYCETLGLGMPDDELKPRLARLRQLTLGDFALVGRQHGFRALGSAMALMLALEAECALKKYVRAPIGFVG